MGSTSILVSLGGVQEAKLLYKAFGEERLPSTIMPTDYRYTGQLSQMTDTGLYYYGARWYDSYLNRFLSPDTIVPDPYNPLDWNRYSYARYNPIRYSDPSGHRVDDGCSWEGCSVENPSQSYVVVTSTLFASPRSWNELPEGYKSVLSKGGVTETSYAQSEMAGKPGVRNANWYEDPVTYISLAGGSLLSKGVTQLLKTAIRAEAVDCTTDGECAATKYVDDVIQFGERSLRHAYDRHFTDWGLPAHRTPVTEELFKQTIVNQVNGPNTQQILGFYRGVDAIHYFDPTTNLNAMTDLQGLFIGGWRLSGPQIINLFTNGKVN